MIQFATMQTLPPELVGVVKLHDMMWKAIDKIKRTDPKTLPIDWATGKKIEISGSWFVFYELSDKLSAGIFNKTDAENYVFKGTAQRVKKVPFQYRLAKQEYHLVPFLPGFLFTRQFVKSYLKNTPSWVILIRDGVMMEYSLWVKPFCAII